MSLPEPRKSPPSEGHAFPAGAQVHQRAQTLASGALRARADKIACSRHGILCN